MMTTTKSILRRHSPRRRYSPSRSRFGCRIMSLRMPFSSSPATSQSLYMNHRRRWWSLPSRSRTSETSSWLRMFHQRAPCRLTKRSKIGSAGPTSSLRARAWALSCDTSSSENTTSRLISATQCRSESKE